MLAALERALIDDYAVAFISFEGLGCEEFSSAKSFCKVFVKLVGRALKINNGELASKWLECNVVNFDSLSGYMDAKNMCKGYLMIFDVRKDRSVDFKAEWVDVGGKKIFEVIV